MNKYLQSLLSFLLLVVLTPLSLADHHNHKTQLPNIVQTAEKAGQFKTLLAAAQAANLVPALSGDGPITVFAPTDDAFGALPKGTIENLLQAENKDQLIRILSFHVVKGQIGSNALSDNTSLNTLAGASIAFTQTEQGFSVQGANIVNADIQASNGLVHVIDRIMLPPEQISRSDAEQMVLAAIQRGVPVFNNGDHHATVDIYASTMQTLIDSAPLLGEERKMLQKALNNSQSEQAMQAAWILRYALDGLIASMSNDLNAARR